MIHVISVVWTAWLQSVEISIDLAKVDNTAFRVRIISTEMAGKVGAEVVNRDLHGNHVWVRVSLLLVYQILYSNLIR